LPCPLDTHPGLSAHTRAHALACAYTRYLRVTAPVPD